jgi:hypothetical protein
VLAHAANEGQSQTAHRAAGRYAARLIERFGRGQVIEWLRVGLPANAISELR